MRASLATAAATGLLAIAGVSRAAARTVVTISDLAPVYAAPAGRPLRTARDPMLEHGSAWVEQRRGDWLGIRTAQRHDGKLGWIRWTPARTLWSTSLLVSVDLSDRRVRVTSAGALLLDAAVAIGASSSPTPATSTSVAARIAVTPSSGYSRRTYGPMIVALRLWQPTPSPGLPAGGLMAFHGGAHSASVGAAVSAGCLRMRNSDVVRLAQLVEPGTPVLIRP